MANRPAPGLVIDDADRVELVRLRRSTSAGAGVVVWARIVLAAGEGVANLAIAERVGVSVPTVLKWRGRYQRAGLGWAIWSVLVVRAVSTIATSSASHWRRRRRSWV
jgi:Homeodomain-like domain